MNRYTSEKAMAEVTLNCLFGHDCTLSMLDVSVNSIKRKLVEILQ